MRGIHKWLSGSITTLAIILILTGNCQAMDAPDSIIELDSLGDLYEPVFFDHAMHVEATEENCVECHHHTTGMPATDKNCVRCHNNSEGADDKVACQECHSTQRFEADYLHAMAEDNMLYHNDKIGLKAAYHLKCFSCHQELDAPSGCQDCHTRNETGDKFYHSGRYAPAPGEQPSGNH